MIQLTPEHARLIIEAHDIDLDDEEEAELLADNNPELHEAYVALIQFAAK